MQHTQLLPESSAPLRQKSRIPCSNATPNSSFQQQNRTVATRFPRFLYHRHTITRRSIPSRHDPFPCPKPHPFRHGPFKNHPILWTPLFETSLVHETRHFHGQTHQNPPFIHETGGSHGQLHQNPPPIHEARHFHGQIPGHRLYRHKAGRAAPG